MRRILILLGAAGWLLAPALNAEESAAESKRRGFAGPTATTSLLDEDATPKQPVFRFPAIDNALQPLLDARGKFQEQTGLQLGLAYTALYQGASDAPDGAEDSAGSGILRLSGKWKLLENAGGDTGSLVFSFDHRHRYTDIAPADLGFAAGYLGIPGTLFSDTDGVVGDVNWQQSFNDGKTGVVIGRYDPNDFFNVLGYANPWSTFQNLAILFNTSIALADYSTGIGAGHYVTDQWYVKGAVNDVNGTATDVQFFEDSDELYITGEIGWTPSPAERYFKNVHITGWRADEREKAGVEESDGVAVSANWTWDQTYMLFAKLGWSDGSAPLYNESYTVGGIYYFADRSDLVGLGINYGSPADSSLDDQVTSELFYRMQFSQNLAITPSVQLINDPALNPDEDTLWIGSVRARLAL